MPTRCPVCDELHREHSQACKEEATASLQQRYETMLKPAGERSSKDTLKQQDEVILSSKKRQLKIASRIEQHRAMAHTA